MKMRVDYMKLKRILLFACLLMTGYATHAQKVNVNHFTGTPTVMIPLYNVVSGGCTLPVSLVYATNGVRTLDLGRSAGRDWQLNAGGEITRVLRGLPDDCKKDLNNNDKIGWLYNNKGSLINSFTIANDNNSAICTDETSDINYINTNFSDLADTEPDIFMVDAPNLSCKLVFDNNHNIRTIPYKDVKVTYATDVSGAIISFNIVNDKGITYTFSDREISTKKTRGTPANISYYKNEYSQFSGTLFSGGISYTSKWGLTRIADANGNFIAIRYDVFGDPSKQDVSSVDSVNLIKGAASGGSTVSKQFIKTITYRPRSVSEIFHGYGTTQRSLLYMNYEQKDYSVPVILKVAGMGKEINFNYLGLSFLDRLSWGGRTYQFEYNKTIPGEQYIPDSTSKQMDYWGYYNNLLPASLKPQIFVNPSNMAYERYRVLSASGAAAASFPYTLSGTNRSVDPASIIGGTLKKISYSEGGSTSLTYEPNDYYDNTSATILKGGGVRIKQIVDYDGISTANNVVRNFSYLNPSTGLSSGKPIALPSFAFTTPYTGSGTTSDLWNYSTVRSESNLSEEDNSVIYTHVKESLSGAGSTLFEFSAPATNWDLSAAPDWTPTIVNVARPTCASYGFVKNDLNTYPYPPNVNFEFERGLLKNVTSFNETGNKVSETSYSYQRTGTPITVTGFRWEDNATVKSYAKYNIYTSTGELRTEEVNKIYDSATLTTAQQTTTKIYYAGSNHKLPTLTEVTNSDGSINRSYTSYVKDFNAAGATDSNAVAISNLQLLNINAPVEKYVKVERAGVNRTVGADLVKFKAFNPTGSANLYLPSRNLKFHSASGVTDFAPASVNSGTSSNDPRYVTSANYRSYDFSGFLQTTDDNNRNQQTVITDHISMQPVASISNAYIDEVAYNDFNSETTGCGFTKSTYSYSTDSRTGKFSLSLPALTDMTRVIRKNAYADNYVFSIWVNTTTSGTLTVSLTNSSNVTLNYNLTLINSGGKWKYYELNVPLTSMSANFTASFRSSIAVLIDDVLFYPEQAEVSTAAYDEVSFNKTAETNTNGVSQYHAYDTLGRLTHTYDQDKQIVLKRTYKDPVFSATLGSVINSNSGGTTNATFTVNFGSGVSQVGMTYQWNFGDGSPIVSGTTASQAHTFVRAGTYTVTVSVISAVYGTNPVSTVLTVGSNFVLHYNKVATGGQITSMQLNNTGSGPSYNFTEAQLLTNPSLAQGTYNVTINFQKIGGTFKSITWEQSDIDPFCFIATSTTLSPINFTEDLNGANSLTLTISATTCTLW